LPDLYHGTNATPCVRYQMLVFCACPCIVLSSDPSYAFAAFEIVMAAGDAGQESRQKVSVLHVSCLMECKPWDRRPYAPHVHPKNGPCKRSSSSAMNTIGVVSTLTLQHSCRVLLGLGTSATMNPGFLALLVSCCNNICSI
jgi:hypothetical protein